MRPIRAALSLCVLTLSLHGQEPPLNYTPVPRIVPLHIDAPVFGRSMVANLSGHELPDLVVLASGSYGGAPVHRALILSAPGVHNSAVPLTGTECLHVSDAAVIRGGDPGHGRDAIALVTDQGLYRWTFGGGLVQYGRNLWNSAPRVRVGDVDGDGFADAIGRMAIANNLRCASLGGGVTGWGVDTGAPVLDHLVVDWVPGSGPARDEIMFAHSSGLHFIRDGVVDPSLSQPLPPSVDVRLARLDDGNGDLRIAIAYTDTQGISWLGSIARNGSGRTNRQLPHLLAGLSVVKRPGMHDGVVVTWADDPMPSTFAFDLAANGALGFDGGTQLPLNLGSNTATAEARLVDLDGDGDLDPIGGSTSLGAVVMNMTPGGQDHLELNSQFVQGGLQYTFVRPTTPAWATHAEVIYFQFERTYNEFDEVIALTLDGCSRGRECLLVGEGFLFPETWPTVVSLAQGPVATLMRYVHMENGVIVQRGPLRPFLWCGNPTERALLLAMVADQLGIHPTDITVEHGGGVGGAITPPKLPPPDDDPPSPPDGTGG